MEKDDNEARLTTVGASVSLRERDVVRALAFIQGGSMSDVIYPWIKPYLDAAGRRPDVQAILAQKEKVTIPE